MRDSEQSPVDRQLSTAPGATVDWRRLLMGWGLLVLIAAGFVGGATKAGMAAKVISAAGLLMIVLPAVALGVHWLRSKGKGEENAPAGSRFCGNPRPRERG